MTEQFLPEGPMTDDDRPMPAWAEHHIVQRYRPSEVPEGVTAWEAFDHTDHFHKRYDDLAAWLEQEPDVWVFLETSSRRVPGGVTSPYSRRGIQVACRKRKGAEKESYLVFVRYAPEKMAQRSRYAPDSAISEMTPGVNPLPE